MCLPRSSFWSLSRDLTSVSQGSDLSLDFSYCETKGRKTKQRASCATVRGLTAFGPVSTHPTEAHKLCDAMGRLK